MNKCRKQKLNERSKNTAKQTTLAFWYRLILSEFEHVKQWAADNKMVINIFLKPRNLFSSVQV